MILANRGGYQNFQKSRQLIDKNLAATEMSVLDRRVRATIDSLDPLQSRRKESISIYEAMVLDQSATLDDRFELAKMYLAEGNWVQASIQLRSLIGANGDEPRYLATYIDALLEHEETSNAETYLERLEKISPNHISTIALQARMLVAKNQADKAFELLKEFIDRPKAMPAERNVRIRLTTAYFEQLAAMLTKPAQKPAAERFIHEAETLLRAYLEKNAGHEWELVEFLGRQKRFDEALELLDRTWDSYHPAVLGRVCSILVAEKMGAEQIGRLTRILQAAMKCFDRPIPLLMPMADLCSRRNRYADAEDLYREIPPKEQGQCHGHE